MQKRLYHLENLYWMDLVSVLGEAMVIINTPDQCTVCLVDRGMEIDTGVVENNQAKMEQRTGEFLVRLQDHMR